VSGYVTTFRAPDLPVEPLSFAAPDSYGGRAGTGTLKRVMRSASDGAVRAPLWAYPPYTRPAVLHERRRRFGVPTADDFDPEYH
jgi:hypothetical protein